MGQGSGHGSYHGSYHDSLAVDDDDEVEETSPMKPKKPSRRQTKAKGKAKEPEPTKKVEPWSTKEEVILCKAFCGKLEGGLNSLPLFIVNYLL